MPNIAAMHPYVVHIVVGLLIAGGVLRLVSLLGKWQWTSPAATTALLLGTVAAVVAVRSGTDAHGPVERIPGVRSAVMEHEELGEQTRNIFFVVSALELAGLAMVSRRRLFHFASAAVGVYGLFLVFETAEHGGELVYEYAGGPGLRTGHPEDIGRLLRAGLYNQAMLDRRENRLESAASLIDEMGRRWPDDPEIQVMAADSKLRDAGDPAAALAAAEAIVARVEDPRLKRNATLIEVYALAALGQKDSARSIAEQLATANPNVARYRTLADSLK